MKRFWMLFVLMLLLLACNVPGGTPTSEVSASPPTLTQPVPTEVQLIWFAPLPPLPVVEGRAYTGSYDFMQLFMSDAPWSEAAGHVDVLKLYGEWVGYATETELERVIQNAQERGFKLAMEFGPLDAEGCGEGIEGFSGVSYAVSAAKRIKALGGTLDYLAMDEPFYYGHFYDGPNACRWSAEKIAEEIDQFVKSMQGVFPEIQVGDTEAMAGSAGAEDFKSWIETFREVNGYDLAFLHMDVDWSRPTWMDEVIAIEEHGDKFNVPVGIIYSGNAFDKTDEEWLSAAGERVKKLEIEKHAEPDHVLFQSWNDKPDFTLPETTDFTFTNFINDYFADKSTLGYRREGEGVNLALGKSVQVSHSTGDLVGSLAVDGDLGTLWNSGGGPTQWIEIDLGNEYTIREIRLSINQFPEGITIHHLLAKGAGGQFTILTTFEGNTDDGQVLSFVPAQPLTGIQFIRVETVTTPSWVSWREIEVLSAGE